MSNALSEEYIDNIVIKQAENDSLWEEPIYVRKEKSFSLSIPVELAERAILFAKVHKEKGIEEWLTRIIRERIELEEFTFNAIKHELENKI
ncbi:MAG TPA: hypothetical protein VJL89_09455 [Thermodesulfovibrionia bacterium]|nr:hypothetical protein [Thermodesulfovibrionia bacterium]